MSISSYSVTDPKIVHNCFEIASKKLIDALPCVSLLFDENNGRNTYLFGGVLRNIVRYLFDHNTTEQLGNIEESWKFDANEFIEEYLSSGTSDVDIGVNKMNNNTFKFFQDVYDKGGQVWYLGREYESNKNSCAQYFDNIILNTLDVVPEDEGKPCWDSYYRSRFIDGHYLVSMPVELSASKIRYDVIIGDTRFKQKCIDFTINALQYPSNQDRRRMFADIEQMRLQLYSWKSTENSKILLRAVKMFRKGYTFHTFGESGYIQRLYQLFVLQHFYTKVYEFPQNLVDVLDKNNDDRSLINIGRVETQRCATSIVNDEIQKLLCAHAMPLHKWALPDSGTGFGVTQADVVFWKVACVKVYVGNSKPTYSDIASSNNFKIFRILVKLEAPFGTRFCRKAGIYKQKCGVIVEPLKFRFEHAVVKGFYSYPNIELKEIGPVFSDYDQSFFYKLNDVVNPTSDFEITSNDPCNSGIHGFIDPETAWLWTGARTDIPELVHPLQRETNVPYSSLL